MNDDRRNPYVLLGVPYGASVAEARRAFARRSRDARWGDRTDADLTDLEWAVARIEHEHEDPTAVFGTYRVPADPDVLRPPAGFGLLAPAPRAAARRSPTAPDEEIGVVFDAARLDAAQHLLDRTSAAAGKKLERLIDAPMPTITVPTMPIRRRGWAPVIAVAAVAVAVLAVAGISAMVGNDESASTTTTTASTSTVVVTTVPPSTVPVTTAAFGGEPGMGETIELSGIEITPHDPLDGYGHLCLIFTIDGDVPLGFVRDRVTLVSAGIAYDPALGVTTGRAPNTDVFGDPAPADREICFPVQGWQDRNSDLVYATEAGNYRWSIGT
jgi:hypothetical protein